MEQKTKISTIIGQYGVLFGLIMILEFVIGYVFNIDPQTNKIYGIVINVLNFLVLPFVFCFLGAQNYKKSQGGLISIGESLKIGVGLTALGSLINGIFFMIFTIMFPEYIDELIAKVQSITIQQNPNMSLDQIKMMTGMMKKMMSPIISIPLGIVMYSFIALIHSVIVGLIVKKEQASF
jgi:hypothetical protein